MTKANATNQWSLQRKLWLISATVLVALSVICQFSAGWLPSIIRIHCAGSDVFYALGVYSICVSNNPYTVWQPPHPDTKCTRLGPHSDHVPTWIDGTHILMGSGAVASTLCLLLMLLYIIKAPSSLSLTIADGFAAMCFSPAAMHICGLLNLSSGITETPTEILEHIILPTISPNYSSNTPHVECESGPVHYSFGVALVTTAIFLLLFAGVACVLCRIMQDKAAALTEYQQYLRDTTLVVSLGDAYSCKEANANSNNINNSADTKVGMVGHLLQRRVSTVKGPSPIEEYGAKKRFGNMRGLYSNTRIMMASRPSLSMNSRRTSHNIHHTSRL